MSAPATESASGETFRLIYRSRDRIPAQGRRAELGELLARIETDPRHDSVELLETGTVSGPVVAGAAISQTRGSVHGWPRTPWSAGCDCSRSTRSVPEPLSRASRRRGCRPCR